MTLEDYEHNLNSIMFLLIQRALKRYLDDLSNLNSIMFLLIPNLKQMHCLRELFKFHYVSINSTCDDKEVPLDAHLNSIMFLLIQ